MVDDFYLRIFNCTQQYDEIWKTKLRIKILFFINYIDLNFFSFFFIIRQENLWQIQLPNSPTSITPVFTSIILFLFFIC